MYFRRGDQPYTAVPTDFGSRPLVSTQTILPRVARKDAPVPQRSQRSSLDFNYRPVPLRAGFLISFVVLFVGCIALVEVLLRSTVSQESFSSAAVTSLSSVSTTRNLMPRQTLGSWSGIRVRDDTTNDGRPTTYICPGGQPTPTNDIAREEPRASLCSEFSATFAANTRNMSYPMQTSLSQFLLRYNAASQAGWDYGWYSDCPTTNAFGTFYRTVDMLCELATFTVGYNACRGIGTAYIDKLALVRTSMSLCGITRNTVIDATATDTVVSKSPSDQPSVNGVTIAAATPLPTVTIPAESNPTPPASVSVPATPLPTVTIPAEPTPIIVASVSTPSTSTRTVISITNGVIQSEPTDRSSLGAVVVAVVSIPVTTVTTDAQGGEHTIISQVDPAALVQSPTTILVTTVTTDAQGGERTIISEVDAAALVQSPTTVLVASGQDHVTIVATKVSAGLSEASATVVMTDSKGIIQTVVVATNQLSETTRMSVITKANGQDETSVDVGYVLTGTFTTFLATKSDGHVETVLSKVTDLGQKVTATTRYTSIITSTRADGSITTFSAVVIQTVVQTGTPTPTISQTATTSPTAFAFVLASHEKIVNEKYSSAMYILAMYLPALLAVIIKAMWEMVFAAIKLMEPFDRMAAKKGTDARRSVFSEYLSSSLSLDSFRSLTYGNPLPFLAGILYIVVQILTPLASASMTIRARAMCNVNGEQVHCLPTWIVNVTLLRVAEVIMGLCALIVLLVLCSLYKRRSRLRADPSSLAAVAALMNYEPLLRDLQKVDQDADQSSFESQFTDHRFYLDFHATSNEQYAHGIIGLVKAESRPEGYSASPLELGGTDERIHNHRFSRDKTKHHYQSVQDVQSTRHNSSYQSTSFTSRVRKHFVSDICGLALPTSLITIILVFYLDNDDSAFNRFFSSNSIIPKFVLVIIATATSLHLSYLERLVRIVEPFRRLAANAPSRESRRPVPPETTILISRAGTPYSNLPANIALFATNFWRPSHGGAKSTLFAGGMLFQLLMSLSVILADLNILVVAGIPYSDAMTWSSYQLSNKISIALTGWILLIYAVLIIWWRRTAPVRYLGGRSISKGVGTIGGLMRWLASGYSGESVDHVEKDGVVGAVLRVREESRLVKWNKRIAKEQLSKDGEAHYYGATFPERTVVWFGRTGVEGPGGQEGWALMCRTYDLRKGKPEADHGHMDALGRRRRHAQSDLG